MNARALGHEIARVRQLRGLEQQELAEMAGLSGSTISRIERALIPNPKLMDVEAIARALQIATADLLAVATEASDMAPIPKDPRRIVAEKLAANPGLHISTLQVDVMDDEAWDTVANVLTLFLKEHERRAGRQNS